MSSEPRCPSRLRPSLLSLLLALLAAGSLLGFGASLPRAVPLLRAAVICHQGAGPDNGPPAARGPVHDDCLMCRLCAALAGSLLPLPGGPAIPVPNAAFAAAPPAASHLPPQSVRSAAAAEPRAPPATA